MPCTKQLHTEGVTGTLQVRVHMANLEKGQKAVSQVFSEYTDALHPDGPVSIPEAFGCNHVLETVSCDEVPQTLFAVIIFHILLSLQSSISDNFACN